MSQFICSASLVAKVENELQKIREGVLALTDKKLIRSPSTDESKAFYYKMRSDYYRYLAEFATCETKSKAGEDACDACVEANKIAENDLAVTHPVRVAMDTKFLWSLKTRCSETNEKFDRRVADRQAELKAVIDAIGILNSDTSFDTYDKTVSTDFLQMSPLAGEQALRQRANRVIDGPVVQVEHVPQSQVAEETVEIAQLDVLEKIAETPQTKTIQGIQAPESLGTTPVCQVAQTGHVEVEIETSRPTESASTMFVSTPVLPVVEEQAEASKVLKTGFNRVLWSRSLQTLLFHFLKRPLRCLLLGRKKRHNML